MTNVAELFQELVELGQYPKEKSDTVTVLEKIGHFLDDEVERLYNWFKPEGYSICLLYTSPSPRDRQKSRMPSSA